MLHNITMWIPWKGEDGKVHIAEKTIYAEHNTFFDRMWRAEEAFEMEPWALKNYNYKQSSKY